MSWMFRWLESLLARLPRSRDDGDKWVEPSNAITRAIMSASFALPAVATAAVTVAVEVEAPAAADAPEPAVEETGETLETGTKERHAA